MVYRTKKQQSSGSYQLSEKDGIIVVTITGKITGPIVRNLSQSIKRVLHAVRNQNGKAVVLIDAGTLRFTDVDSSARTEGRRMLSELEVDNWAVYGKAPIGMLVDYIGRAAGVGNKMHYFSDKRQAFSWLKGENDPKPSRSSVGLVVGIAILLIGILGLAGWWLDNPYFKSLLPSLRPINPVAAAGLVALGIAFMCYWRSALRPLRVLGVTGVVLGVTALLPLNIDTILFSDAVRASGAHTQLADSAAICFILSGLLGLLANRNGKWVQPLEYTLAAIMGVIATINIYGQLYSHDFIYGISENFVMALNLAIAFFITAAGMIILVLLRRTKTALLAVTRSGWLIVMVLLLVQVATYISWVQSRDRNIDDSQHAFSVRATSINDQVNTRLQAYVSALHGFRGLFTASSNVSQGDFEAYYDSLNLKQTYPGVRAIAFIAAVKTKDLQTFENARKADDSLVPGGNKAFKLQNISNEPLHFIGAYAADTPNLSTLGRDLTAIPGRSSIYNNALKSNGYYSSGTITYAATATQAAAKGFFIATPVSTSDSDTPIGVVTANFNYQDFFGAILKTVDDDKLSLTVHDTATNELIYWSGEKTAGDNAFSQKLTISLAQNQSWRVEVRAPQNYGVTASQSRFANAVLFFGQLFTLLLLGIFIQQIRGRSQALALADAVTEDLQHERDTIAGLHLKDEAMIAGIGDGLLVVDPSGKIEVANEAAQRLLGFDEHEMVGKNVLEVVRALDDKGQLVSESSRPFIKAQKKAKTVTAKLIYIRKDYRQVPVKVTVAPIILHGELIGTIEVFADITREKQLEHMKDEFLSVASHELRTPMGAIRANLSMILSGDYGPVNKDLVEPLTDMKASTIRLVELVNDLLNVARIEAGRMRFDLADISINEAAKMIVNDLAPLGKEKGVKISLEAPKAPLMTQADGAKVKEVLVNLIGNSLKFTDKGSITVTVNVDNDMAEVSVKDTGIGITPEDQKKLFGKFNQITSAQAGKPAGTGLGLYISREMIRRMGGDMWIKASIPTNGSIFAFTLPLEGTTQAKKAKKVIEQEAKLHPDQV